MAAHRYWRADLLRTAGRFALQLSEFHLLAGGVRVDTAAVLTATAAPTTGSLAALSDDDTGTSVEWAYPLHMGLSLQWDFGGSAVEVDDIRLGAVNVAASFLRNARIQFSDDGATWADYYMFELISWPGARTKTSSSVKAMAVGATATLQQLYAEFEGANGQTTFTDSSVNGVTLTGVGGPVLSNAVAPPSGTTSLLLNGTSQYVALTPLSKIFSNHPGATTWEFQFRTSSSARQTLFSWVSNSSYAMQIYIEAVTGLLQFTLSSASTTGVPVNDGAWHKLAIVNSTLTNPSVVTIFLDGKLVARFAASSGFTVGVANVSAWIGAHRTASVATAVDFFNGNIKNVIISQSLTAPRYTRSYVPFNGLGAGPATINTDSFARVTTARPLVQATGAVQPATPVVRRSFTPLRYLRARKDYYTTSFAGLLIGRVAGTTKKHGMSDTPVSRKVRLVRERDGLQIAETWSEAATGAYSFDWIDESEAYTVYSLDYLNDFRAVIADNLKLANGGVTLLEEVKTQAPSVFVRSAWFGIYASTGATNMIFPAVIAENDLLMVVMQTGTPNPTVSARWTLRGVQPYTATGGTTRYVHVYTTTGRAVDAGQAETVSFSVADRSTYVTMAISQTNGKQPAVTAFNGTAINTTANQAIAVPDITTGNGERIGIAIAASANANATPAPTSWSISNGPWTSRTATSLDQLRMAVWTKPLIDAVLSMAGTVTVDQGAGATNGLAALSVIVSPV